MWLDNVTEWSKKLTETGVALIALAVVMQVLFGSSVAFLPGDGVGTLTGMINTLGSANLVGLIAVGLLYKIFTRS